MNKSAEFILKSLHKIHTKLWTFDVSCLARETDPDKASASIYRLLICDKPCMIARFGSVELNAVTNYVGITNYRKQYRKYITNQCPQWWWNTKGLEEMRNNAGFFPSTPETVSRFSELMIEDMSLVDLLGSWRPQEIYFQEQLKQTIFVHLRLLEPFWSKFPWTKALQNKKVLVIHPFAETIEKQYYNHRSQLFNNPDILPLFTLKTIKAIQSLGGKNSRFENWFAALEWMKNEIDKQDYEIALLGCGAYGFPLAAHIKRQGKKAFHLGGSLQLLFGIRGKRWEDPQYGVKEWGIPFGSYSNLMNEYWVRPLTTEQIQNMEQIEGACYW